MTGYRHRTCSAEGCREPVVSRTLCRKHYQAAWKAGDFKNAPLVPRRKLVRFLCPPEHKHADSSTCYIQHQCRCDPCTDNRAARERRRQKLIAYGRFDTGLLDAGPVREHLLMMGEFGMGYKRVAALAGIGITSTRNLIWGRQDPGPRYGELQKRVKRETAVALLAVKPALELLAPNACIPARGVHRRVQALVARGWSQSKLSDRLGMERSNFGVMMNRDRVTVRRHLAVAALYEELWDQLPPHQEWRDAGAYTRSLTYARQRRWLPPLAWDDIDTDIEPPAPDEEEAGIDHVLVELACAGDHVRLSVLERREAITRLNAAKLNDHVIAERLNINVRTVLRIRQELGLTAAVGPDKQIVA